MAQAHTLGFAHSGADLRLQLGWEALFEQTAQALAQGHDVKPLIVGPLSYLWLDKTLGDEHKLDLLDSLLPLYAEVLSRLAAQGVEWVQIDEPILSLDLPQQWKNAFERAYHILQYSPLKKLLATKLHGLQDNLGLAVGLPVQGLHIDAVAAPEELTQVLDRLPIYKVLSVGMLDGRTVWRCELEQALDRLEFALERFGDNLWVGSAGSLLRSPLDLGGEQQGDAELNNWSAFAVQKTARMFASA